MLMFTAKFRECRSVLSDVPLVGSLVKGGRVAFEQSRRSLVVAHTHGASVPSRIEPVAEFADRLQSAPLSRGFSCASDANLRHDGESVRDLFREVRTGYRVPYAMFTLGHLWLANMSAASSVQLPRLPV